jgi:hypothetical protein
VERAELKVVDRKRAVRTLVKKKENALSIGEGRRSGQESRFVAQDTAGHMDLHERSGIPLIASSSATPVTVSRVDSAVLSTVLSTWDPSTRPTMIALERSISNRSDGTTYVIAVRLGAKRVTSRRRTTLEERITCRKHRSAGSDAR